MPKRVLDFDAMWASDKLASCAAWAQAEYAWFYGLADASGSFEITNLRVIWGRVAAIRTNLTIERLEQIFDEFILRGLLFTWEESGKRYAHWTGSDVPGRLPPPSWRARLEKLAPPVPQKQLAAYVARFSRGTKPAAAALAAEWDAADTYPHAQPPSREHTSRTAPAVAPANEGATKIASQQHSPHPPAESPLKAGLEPTQAQGLDLDLDENREREGNSAAASQSMAAFGVPVAAKKSGQTNLFFPAEKTAEQPRTSYSSAAPLRYARNEQERRVLSELYVGAGPVINPHSTTHVKPEALERARRTAEAAAAARNARRARPG